MSIIEKLSEIQQKMKAPKNLYNSFGKYSYRNAEGILEAFKPFEGEYKVALTVSDDIVNVGDRIYVKATATLRDCETLGELSVTAFARESFDKKGMDDSQITGTASSYARKYALNGLLLLDDTKDPDTDEFHALSEKGKKEFAADAKRIAAKKQAVETICKKHNIDPDNLCTANGISWRNITEEQLESMGASLKRKFGDE